ncbi:hypothetical protein ACFQ0O_17975 [Saccharopolyspora spinosporotrichia]
MSSELRSPAAVSKPARRACSSVIVSGSTASTAPMAMTPAAVRIREPVLACGLAQRRKARVIRPSTTPRRTRLLNNTRPR